MRCILEFETEKLLFPLDYRRVFLHFFKSFLAKEKNGEYYEKYYHNNAMKDFSFAVFFEKPTFKKTHIEMEGNRIRLLFTTSDQLTGLIFMNGFLSKKYVRNLLENENFFTLVNIKSIPDMNISGEKMIVRMESPLVIREHDKESKKDWYYSVTNDLFKEKAETIIKKQLIINGFSIENVEKLTIQPLITKKTVVKHYNCSIEASLGTFMFEGTQDILNYLLHAGIGSRASAGFGCCELLSSGA